MPDSTLDTTESGLVSSLKDIALQLKSSNNGDAEWTYRIKEAIGRQGKENYSVCTAGFPRTYESEWLFDLVWYAQNDDFYTSLVLACEIEWKTHKDCILYDFEKLLVARAKYRLMVFQSLQSTRSEWTKYLIDAIDRNLDCLPGDRFLLACYDPNDEAFHFEHIIQKEVELDRKDGGTCE